MVNTLSGSVSAYRNETIRKRYIRVDDAMSMLDVSKEEALEIALAAGARYQLAKITLIHKERLMEFMKHFTRVPSSNKIVEKKFVRIGEGSMTYSIGHHRFIEMARAAGAVYKIGTAKGNTILINLEVFDEYMEQFREPATKMKHPMYLEDESHSYHISSLMDRKMKDEKLDGNLVKGFGMLRRDNQPRRAKRLSLSSQG